MITGRQIRAARGLLGWDATALAKKTGLTRETISRIEGDAVSPREGTLNDINRAFDEHGVEFTDNQGVRLKPQGVEVLVGKDGLIKFFEDVYDHVRKFGGVVQQTGVDEALFSQYMGEYEAEYDRKINKLIEERRDISFQALIRMGDMNFACSNYAEYRWLDEKLFSPVPFYIYGEKLAIISFQTVPAPTIVVHSIPAITEAYKKQFSAMWEGATVPPAGQE